MLDNLFKERLQENNLLPIGSKQQMLLVETSYYNPPMNFHKLLKEIQQKGYHPLLAHPERYRYMDFSDYQKLKESGILFQLNLPSLAGMYGETIQKKAEGLLKKGYYDYVGGDTHHLQPLKYLCEQKLKSSVIESLQQISNRL